MSLRRHTRHLRTILKYLTPLSPTPILYADVKSIRYSSCFITSRKLFNSNTPLQGICSDLGISLRRSSRTRVGDFIRSISPGFNVMKNLRRFKRRMNWAATATLTIRCVVSKLQMVNCRGHGCRERSLNFSSCMLTLRMTIRQDV